MGFKLAMAQMLVEGGEPKRNVARAVARIEEAARAGAQVALLPEALDLGWTHPRARELAEPIPGGTRCAALADAARRHGVYVCAGLTERSGEEVYNAAVLIAPDGELMLHHRKLNELEIGHDCYAQGDRLAVARTPLATFGLMICADAFAPGEPITRSLCYMGADVILSPCAWAVPAGHDPAKAPYGDEWRACYAAISKEYSVWIAGTSNVGMISGGPWAGRPCIGNSIAFAPGGREAMTGPYGAEADTILYLDIEPTPRPARGDGWAPHEQLRERG